MLPDEQPVLQYNIQHSKQSKYKHNITVLKESDDLVILGIIFDSKILLRNTFGGFIEQLLKGLIS